MRRFFYLALAGMLAALAGPAAAQLPGGGVGGAVGGVLGSTQGTLGDVQNGVGQLQNNVGQLADGAASQTVGALRDARADRLNVLRREHPELIDVDTHGAAVLRSQVLAIAPSPEALAAAQRQGFVVAETHDESALGLTIVVLRAPANLSTRRAVEALRRLDPQGSYDYDHLYLGAGETGAPREIARQSNGGGASSTTRIGLIDGGVDANHPALAGLSIHQRAFASAQPSIDAHGTAVASLLASDSAGFRGAAPGASLYVADVYGGSPSGGGAAAIVAALGWLAEQRAPVINISLVGPPNRALEAGVRAMIARGFVVVAAVGNDGPSAPPLYPASYPGVIGVTGVDARNRVLPEAGRGRQVDFAAPGMDMSAAAPGGAMVAVRGTSFAAPIVAGLIARRLAAPNAEAAARADAELERMAQDLGARGRDPVFGAGLVGADVRVAPQRVASRR